MTHVRRSATPAVLVMAALAAAACASAPGTVPAPPAGGADAPPAVEREFRGAWIASVANLDWPSQPGLPPDSQRAELRRQLDRAAELKLNAVIFQVRPAADALYASSLEPWSEWLTGEQGRAPEPFYDPLEFAVAEAHARGLELHAWFNPYRAVHPSARGPMAASHISRANPELVVQYGSYGWMDPGSDAVRQRSLDVIVDVVRRYDIDGVHIDDYFYPYRESDAAGREIDFPDSLSYARYRATGGTLDRSHWRRWNVDRFVAEMYAAVKREKPWVKVGISPIGTWRPNVVPQLGGFDAYESIYADARKWIMDGDLDYLVPQLYWPIARVDMSFPVLLDWWARQNPHGRAVYAGLIPDRVNHSADPRSGWLPDEILGQIYIARSVAGSHGHVHFRMRSLMPGGAIEPVADTVAPARADSMRAAQVRLQGRRDSLTARLASEAYARPALVPAMPWLDDVPPPAPSVTFSDARRRTIAIRPHAAGEAAFLWVVQWKEGAAWRTDVLPAATRTWVLPPPAGAGSVVWVSAVDRVGNRSEPVPVAAPSSGMTPASAARRDTLPLPDRVVSGADWRERPAVGYAADGVRRNIPRGGTLQFRDLRIDLLATHLATADGARSEDAVELRVAHDGGSGMVTAAEGTAFTAGGYRIAVVAVHGPGELGEGLTSLEVAALATVPPEVAASADAGGAAMRLRVPHEITRITLHHTGSAEPLRPTDDPVMRLRGLQAWGEAERNWWDVPYHFLIDLDGNVYEGRDWRYTGETNTTYDPGGHFLISVIGNYEIQEPTPAQVEAIVDMMAWAARSFGITTDRIGGHYDYAETSCPGVHFRRMLEDGTFRRGVDAALDD